MTYTTCEDCGCRVYKYGCVNCNEADYILMQDQYDSESEAYAIMPDEPEDKR